MTPFSSDVPRRRLRHPRLAPAILTSLCLCAGAVPLAVAAQPPATVGWPVRLDGLVLPGPEVEVKPLDDRRTPIVLRIVHVWPHGTAFRYDLEYYGLEPGTFDLKDFLRRKDRTSTADLPPLPVTVRAGLPPGQVTPNELEAKPSPWLGGYRMALIAGAVAWGLGLAAILLVGRRRRVVARVAARPITLADHLRPLLEGACAGRLPPSRLAELERTLIIFWTRRLRLHDRKPTEALATLRGHPEAGPLLDQLERWLHHPGPSATINVAALLEPYQGVLADGPDGATSPS